MTAPINCIDWASAFRSAAGWTGACGIWRIEAERMAVRTAGCGSMGLYLQECRGVLVTLGGQAKNSDNAPKGFPGGASPQGPTAFRDHHRHCDDRSPLTPPFVRRQG